MSIDEFVDMVRKTRIFLRNLVSSIASFIYGGIFASYWLIVAALAVIWWVWVIVAVLALVVGFFGKIAYEHLHTMA